MKLFNLTNTGGYFLLMTLFFIVSPLLCLIISLFYYKKTVSHFFFILYAFYWGYKTGANLDLMMHYENYLKIMDNTFWGMYSDIETLYLGQEPYHIIFKYILSRFHATQQIFAGCACASYTTFFIFFIRQLKPIYSKNINVLQELVLMTIAIVVEFYWYFGIRFWTGCFIFMTFFCKFVITGKLKYLFLTPICMLFHITLATIVFVAFLSYFLKNHRISIYFIFFSSFLFRFIDVAFDKIISSLGFVKYFYKSNYQKEFYQQAIAKVTKERLESGNIVYDNRIPLMLLFCFFIFIFLKLKNIKLNLQHPQMFAMILLTIAISNFGFSDYLFYERFLKFATLLSFTYLFFVLDNPLNQWIFKFTSIKVAFILIVVLSLIIALYQQRMIIGDINLWLGNSFSNISLNELHNGYKK